MPAEHKEESTHRLERRRFVRLGAEHGLPPTGVYALHTDKLGFLWVGTQSGLARWDGQRFRNFKSDTSRPHSLPGGFVIALSDDEDDRLWVATYDGGCATFDRKTERFSKVDTQPVNSQDEVGRCVYQSRDGVMWIATHASITAIESNGKIAKYYHPKVEDPFIIAEQRFPIIVEVDSKTLFIGSAAGGFLFDTRKRQFRYLSFDDKGLLKLTTHGITSAAWLNGTLYVSTSPQLYRLDKDQNKLTLVEPLINNIENQGHYAISSLAADEMRKELWIGSTNGLLVFSEATNRYAYFLRDNADEGSLPANGIQALHIDRNSVLWIGTGAGVAMLNLGHPFRHIELPVHESPIASVVRNSVVDPDGVHWIATGYGLVEYDPKTKQSIRHDLGGIDDKGKQSYNSCIQVSRGAKGLWVGTTDGLIGFDPKTRRVTAVLSPNKSAARTNEPGYTLGNHVQGVLEDAKGRVWCGSEANGMQWQHLESGTCRYFIYGSVESADVPSDTLTASFEDSSGRLWFGFVTFLSYYDEASQRFVRIPSGSNDADSLGNAMISVIFEDSAKTLWVGTAAGLYKCTDRRAWKFRKYDTQDGLPTDFITAIVQHGDDLWIGTSAGICRLRERASTTTIRVLTTADGLFSDEILHRALWMDGTLLYAGTKHGLDVCDTRMLDERPIDIPVVLTDLLIFNESVPIVPIDETPEVFALETSVTESELVELTHRESVITIRFAALDFRYSRLLRYRYMLEGFDTRWIVAGDSTDATYTNLDSRSYIFIVQAQAPDGNWSKHGASLELVVHPAPWKSWWARTLYVGVGLGVAAFGVRNFIERRTREVRQEQEILLARSEEREDIRRQNAADFHDEAGTTLTRILFLSELARRKVTDNNELGELLSKIDANAALLSQGMRDFIWVLDPDHDTLLDTIERVDSFAQSLFGDGEVEFSMRYDRHALTGIVLSINQRRQLLMVCKEALHNALKHAQASTVNVVAVCHGLSLTIEVVDDGAGFDTGETSQGYGLKGMSDRAASIGAELRVASGQGAGTTVTLRMKIPHP